jgi:hypothetical protein
MGENKNKGEKFQVEKVTIEKIYPPIQFLQYGKFPEFLAYKERHT